MPKLIDYPRTSYTGAWEVAEVVDDTGGKCALETCARKLNRKVSGSFKAIVGSAVKFGLLTSKRELLATTTLFRRIKHAYDKQEELLFHREAFLTPPLFSQLCRKFRGRELPVAMLDVLLIREFEVEEINAQNVAKAFVDGARMVNLLDEHHIVADIDQLAAQQAPRRELANPGLPDNSFRQPVISTFIKSESNDNGEQVPTRRVEKFQTPNATTSNILNTTATNGRSENGRSENNRGKNSIILAPHSQQPNQSTNLSTTPDAVANLFDLPANPTQRTTSQSDERYATFPNQNAPNNLPGSVTLTSLNSTTKPAPIAPHPPADHSTTTPDQLIFRIQLQGPGLNTQLEIVDVEDLLLVRGLLNKIERRLSQ